MYQSTSSSSSSQNSMGSSHGGGLARYGSAPGSLLATAVDSVIGGNPANISAFRPQPSHLSHFISSGDSAESSKVIHTNSSNDPKTSSRSMQKPFGFQELALGDSSTARNFSGIGGGSSSSASSSLVRQRSSPAGLLRHFATADNNGFSVTRETGNYSSQGGLGVGLPRLKSQLSFTRQDSLSQLGENIDGVNSNNGTQSNSHSFATTTSFGMGSWDNTNSIVFSTPSNKRAKNIDGDIFNSFNVFDSETTLEMATMEKLLNIPEDSVPCKIRAKRGCATHPRSIAERERRTRISGKLKKLQELVPNMDKLQGCLPFDVFKILPAA